MKEQQNLAAKFECVSWRRATKFDTTTILETNLRRQLLRILQQGKCGLGDEKHLEVKLRILLIACITLQVTICYDNGEIL